MHLCVFEDDVVPHFLPLVHTRAVYDLRVGIRSPLQALREAFGRPGTLLHSRRLVAAVTGHEHDLVVNRIADGLDVLFANGRWAVEEGDLLDRIRAAANEGKPRVFLQENTVVAAWVPSAHQRYVEDDAVTAATFDGLPVEEVEGAPLVSRLWDLQSGIDAALRRDYDVRLDGMRIYERPGVTIEDGAVLREGEQIYIGAGTVVRPGAVLNAQHGPIYIGEDVVIKEGAIVKGPTFIGSNSTVNTGSDIECCSFGYHTKVCGQVEQTVMHSLSNKAHSGYLGNSYVGRWCNFGADTNASNLRSDYKETSMYDAVAGDFVPTGCLLLGLVMGDHAKTGINTMLNTATVIGVCCNIYGAGFMPRHIPSFSWGTADELVEYRVDKALETADVVMRRRDRHLTEAHRENLEAVFEATRDLVAAG